MAAAKPVQMSPQPEPSDVVSEVSPSDDPKVTPTGPVIEYVDEGADKVVFIVNPKATKYVVYASGMILESL